MPGTWQERECLHVTGLMTVKYRWSSVAILGQPKALGDGRHGGIDDAERKMILDVSRSQQDAGIAQQYLSGRVPGRGSLPSVRPGPDRSSDETKKGRSLSGP